MDLQLNRKKKLEYYYCLDRVQENRVRTRITEHMLRYVYSKVGTVH